MCMLGHVANMPANPKAATGPNDDAPDAGDGALSAFEMYASSGHVRF